MTDSRGSGTYIIAEIGVNHDGDVGKALDLVDAVAESGADAVKVQTFTADTLASPIAPKADYQLATTPAGESQHEMLRRLELSRDDHRIVMDAANARGLDFLSTPYDRSSLDFLVNGLGIDQIKIASADITNLPLLLAVGRSQRRVILSTGMASVDEIHRGLSVLAFGAANESGAPTRTDMELPLSPDGYLRSTVVLLQCTSQYPAPLAEANLESIVTLRDLFGLPVGYSDHTVGTTAAVMSVAYGSVMFEKHFTLDSNAPGPDHSASMEPAEFARLIELIRAAETARGSGVKAPSASEVGNRFAMRKSLMAARRIPMGAVVEEADVVLMRPESGDSPYRYWEWIGRTAPREFAQGDALILD